MSDVPPGPGWWIASDGRWYPPEAHPSAAPSPWVVPQPAAGRAAPGWGAPAPQWGAPPPQWGAAPPGYGPPPGAYAPGAYGLAPLYLDPLLGLPLAPWWKRLCAMLIDSAIFGVGAIIVFLVVVAPTVRNTVITQTPGSPPTIPASFWRAYVVLWVVVILGQIVYYGVLNGSRRGQTVGKMALKIAVRDARTGGPIGFWRGAGRNAITILFDIPFGIPLLLDYLSPLWDKRRQAWHDHVVHSVVVEVPG